MQIIFYTAFQHFLEIGVVFDLINDFWLFKSSIEDWWKCLICSSSTFKQCGNVSLQTFKKKRRRRGNVWEGINEGVRLCVPSSRCRIWT